MAVSKEMAEKILRQGEIFLQSTVSVALSADQRAAMMAAVFAAASVAIAGVLTRITDDIALFSAGVVLALLWFVVSVLCIVVLWPSKYHLPGNYPSMWLTEDVVEGDLVEAIIGECENYDERIRFNVAKLAIGSRVFKAAITIAISAPLAALALWGLVTLAAAAAEGA